MRRVEGRGTTIEDRRSRMDDRIPKIEGRRSRIANRFLSYILHPPSSIVVFGIALSAIAGCRQQMADQPRYDPLEASTFFKDGQSARPLPPGTVARGELRLDAHLYQGIVGGVPAKSFPFPVTLAVLQRGQERFNIYCAPCHSRTGDGDGMIVRRGLTRPPSFHSERLREVPPGHVFRVISEGLGAMPNYRQQIPPDDRWAITAYIQALQLSHNSSVADVPADKRAELERGQP